MTAFECFIYSGDVVVELASFLITTPPVQTLSRQQVKSELNVDVARQYVEREVKKARDAKEREISNLQKIQKAWGGVGLKDCFYGWRKYARLNVNDR